MKLMNVKGTSDSLPKEELIKRRVVNTLTSTFEKFGYMPLDTTILCYYDLLASKYAGGSEILKEVYTLNDQGDRKLGLRYDLTVPFSKVISMNVNKNITLPLKRYEVGKVFRDGPVKTGRAREFYQCDVDVCGIEGTFIEAEMLSMTSLCYKKLGIDVYIEVNNRKLLEGFILAAGIDENIKNIKIVTNNVERFKNVEQKIQEILGILIRITNNKRKGLANSQIIINLDFPEELINKYAINPEAIIVNIGQNVKIKSKKFKGINANNIKISMKTNYNTEFEQNKIFNDFEEAELYEASIKNMSFEEIKKKFQKDNVNVTSLIGNNGSINKKEFEEKCKFYVKSIDKMLILN